MVDFTPKQNNLPTKVVKPRKPRPKESGPKASLIIEDESSKLTTLNQPIIPKIIDDQAILDYVTSMAPNWCGFGTLNAVLHRHGKIDSAVLSAITKMVKRFK
jgi:hypothetical protein